MPFWKYNLVKTGLNSGRSFSFVGILTHTETNGVVTATIGTTKEFFVASTKNFAAATERFVDRTKHFVVVTKYFCYPYLNK